MERLLGHEIDGLVVETRAPSRAGTLQFSITRDLPMIVAVRNATFISHGQLYSQLTLQGSEANRQGFCWRLNRLVKAGMIQKMPQVFPFSGATYTITREGLGCLESCGEGLVSLTSESRSLPNVRQATHYLELGEIKRALRSTKILKKWISDIELRSMNLAIDRPLAKDYDAIADLAVGTQSQISVGIEYERTAKSSQRYREIVEVISQETQIRLLLYLTASMDLVYQLRGEFEGLKFPVAVAPSGAFCRNPLGLKMHTTAFKEQSKATLPELLNLLDSGLE
jgi:hypothetical protein